MARWIKINEAAWDRTVRVLGGVLLLVLGFGGIITEGWGLATKIIGAMLVLTGLAGFCPLYTVFGLDTCQTKKK